MAVVLVDLDEAARLLDMTVEEIRDLVRRKEIHAYRVNNELLFKRSELERYAVDQGIGINDQPSPGQPPAKGPGKIGILFSGGDPPGANSIIQAAAEKIKPECEDREQEQHASPVEPDEDEEVLDLDDVPLAIDDTAIADQRDNASTDNATDKLDWDVDFDESPPEPTHPAIEPGLPPTPAAETLTTELELPADPVAMPAPSAAGGSEELIADELQVDLDVPALELDDDEFDADDAIAFDLDIAEEDSSSAGVIETPIVSDDIQDDDSLVVEETASTIPEEPLFRSDDSTPAPVGTPAPAPAAPPLQTSGTRKQAASEPLDENVQFSVFCPNTISKENWSTLLVFAHLDHLFDEVKKQAKAILRSTDAQQSSEKSSRALPKGGEITFIPEFDGVEFNPAQQTFIWSEDIHKCEFRMKADTALTESIIVGVVHAFWGPILLATVPIRLAVKESLSEGKQPLGCAVAKPYRMIFASYSRKDVQIVNEFRRFVEPLGDRYLMDQIDLRAGESWNERLLELIEEADVFQLFWSNNAMQSSHVRDEWQHALSLGRSHFVRPTYWEEPLPESDDGSLPPESLRALHFTKVQVPTGSG